MLEDVFLDCDSYTAHDLTRHFNCTNEYFIGQDFSYAWSLQQYKQPIKKEEKSWDELEKSIITSLADDLIVGVKGRTAHVVIVKNFA